MWRQSLGEGSHCHCRCHYYDHNKRDKSAHGASGWFAYGEFSSGAPGPAFVLLDRYLIVLPFPATGVPPEERENDLPPYGKSLCWQIQVLQVPATLFGAAVLGALPAIEAPVHQGWFHQQKTQLLSA